MGTALAAGAALGAGALVARNPRMAWEAAKRLGRGATNLRYLSMLSGLAPLKSVLGNVGAAKAAALETRSLAPIREFFRPKTASTFFREFAHPSQGAYGEALEQAGSRWNPFGRFMGAGDVATREALQRGGLSAKGAERLVLQSPEYMVGPMAEALQTPVGRYLVPFRRTAFNVFGGGLRAVKEHPGLSAGYGAAGAALGESDVDPRTIALLAPLASVYTLPFALGAAFTRGQRNLSEAEIAAGGLSPISEYGLTSGVTQPLRPFTEPAALRALKYLRGY